MVKTVEVNHLAVVKPNGYVYEGSLKRIPLDRLPSSKGEDRQLAPGLVLVEPEVMEAVTDSIRARVKELRLQITRLQMNLVD